MSGNKKPLFDPKKKRIGKWVMGLTAWITGTMGIGMLVNNLWVSLLVAFVSMGIVLMMEAEQ